MESNKSFENNRLYDFGPFRLNAGERKLLREGEPVALARKVFDLLLILVESAGHLKTREELIEALWPHRIVEEQGLTTKLYALRKALGDEGASPRYIETVRGVGYRFIAPVEAGEIGAENAETAAGNNEAQAKPSHEIAIAGAVYGRRGLMVTAVALVLIVVAGILVWRFDSGGSTGKSQTAMPSIAVLPFENLSTDKANAYFSAGIRDTILTRLADLGGLRVVSRTASDSYPASPKNLGRIGHELGVNTVLEGSVQKAGKQVLINVQLINAHTSGHIWAATYTRKLDDIFKVEGEVATQVATALQTRLRARERTLLTRPPTHDSQAYLLYLKANYNARNAFDLATAPNPASAVARATKLYRQAIARDPKFALAWARLSLLDSKAWWFEIASTSKRKRAARQTAERAIALAPTLPQSHIALGYAYYYGAQDYARALHQFQIARDARPYDANVIGAMAYIHRRQGHWKQALAEFSRAAAIDPRNPRWHDDSGSTLMALRRYSEAMRQFDQALAVAPRDYDARIRQIMLFCLIGKLDRAQSELAAMPRNADPQGLKSFLRYKLFWLTRQPEKALAALTNANPQASNQRPTNLLRANAFALLDKRKRARLDYEKARGSLRTKLDTQPDNADRWSALGLAEAGLGDKTAALAAGQRAIALYPVSKDILAGVTYLDRLAKIYARLGEAELAVPLIAKLLAMPAGREISVSLLRLDPVWDPIRHDPRFQSLLKKYSNRHIAAKR